MSTEALRTLLERHVPADAKEAADRDAMLDFLGRLPAPFSAEQETAHFTASALVVDENRGRTCLVLHRKLGLWLQPGGHVERGDPSIGLAALREVREETGLHVRLASDAPVQVDIHEIPDRPDRPAHLHLDVRFLAIAAGDALTLSEESTDVRWWPLALAATAGDESLARLLRAAT
ncbi:MAG TPA: NUDIX hydrolase [Gaiellaceae bacterium]|nr:NUDIX hydrolase [Gaiellaceae bacterium]